MDAVQHLLGYSDWQDIRAIISDALSSVSSTEPATHSPSSEEKADSRFVPMVVGPTLLPLSEQGRGKLAEEFLVSLRAIDAFAHAFQEDEHGHLFAVHQTRVDTEASQSILPSEADQVQAEIETQFSLWYAPPANGNTPTHLILAPNAIDALRRFEKVPERLREQIGLASTDGPLTPAGRETLAAILSEMKRVHPKYDALALIDACSAAQEPEDAALDAELFNLATEAGIGCLRCKPIRQELQSAVEAPQNNETKPLLQQPTSGSGRQRS